MHWCLGFGHDIGDQFEHRIKHCILHYGGVLAEIRMVQDKLDPTGKNTAVAAQGLETHLPVTIPASTGQSILRSLGHALLILKWEIVRGELIFTYQNSYGEGWGLSPRKKKGRAKSKKKGGAGAKKERTGFGFVTTLNSIQNNYEITIKMTSFTLFIDQEEDYRDTR